ncbi:alpha/beta fold hydrolase [Chitinophaga rhizophila]|uniref:Alpha/beta hydrolase n=1 Tax=Chitinophaga rhizophila TaxID=2866212 RepID=A0ABS7GJV3_9BACT|nr:alpha/beta hydrolase [Chitinophaga rhizophila]MBW8688001.1 alpha/beta hydrolase [Chitinophaga rhizophila]
MRSFLRTLVVSCIALTISVIATAQYTPPATFYQMVDVSAFKGSSFTLECWVYAERLDLSSGTALMALGFNQRTQVGTAVGKLSMADFKAGEWNRLTVSGKIDKKADSLAIGALYSGKDKFFYDDMKLTIKGKEIAIGNSSFEQPELSPWKFMNTPDAVTRAAGNQRMHSGKQALQVDASQIVSTGYGTNDKAGHYADVNGNRIYYEVYGDGEPLLLLHGALESIVSFEKQIPALSQSFKVIAVDTRGHGKSTADTTRLTYELYAADMYQLLKVLKLDAVNVLGWSDGGNTGLIMAMRYPDKVKKLAVSGACLFADTTAIEKFVLDTVRSRVKMLEALPGNARQFELRVSRCLLEEPNIKPSELQLIKSPALIIAGERDFVKAGHTRLIADNIPGSKLLIIDNTTHDVPREAPDLFNKQVEAFFKGR